MRIFEILLIAVVFVALLVRLFRWEKMPWVQLFPLVSLLVLGYHFIMEGARWQMLPLYLLALALVPLAVVRFLNPQRPLRRGLTVAGLVVLLVFGPLPALLPVPVLPVPDGPYSVGTETFYWIDPERSEVYAAEAGQPRKIMVQVWYPAITGSTGERAPYLPDGAISAQALSTSFDFPAFFLNHFNLAKSNAVLDAPLAECFATWPVLLFSHGWNGMRFQNTYQMEALASHGYVVFAADHAYGAVVTAYPDGEVVYNNPEALPSGVSDEEYARAARVLGQSWVGDLRFVLDQVERLNTGEIQSRFADHLDLERIGLFGHSTGGGAVLETCWLDARCKAVLAQDPWLVPYDRQLAAEGLAAPNFNLFSETWRNEKNLPLLEQFWQAAPAGTAKAVIADTGHYDFSDLPLFSPVAAQLGLKGAIPTEREISLINDALLTFFNTHIGIPGGPVSDLPARYPELSFETR